MSSSEEETVRHPGRSTDASRVHSVDASEHAESLVDSDADQLNGHHDDDDADLFGSGSDGDLEDRPHKTLDDRELDSGDDEGRYDRMDLEDMEDGADGETLKVMDLNLARAPEPQSSTGEVYTMALPNFLSLETEEFRPETYVAPPYSTAATSLCWRHDPKDPSCLQSNARIIRWEDGSLTLQLASNPKEQYRISAKPLAPLNKSGTYEANLDTHTYLAAAAETSSVFRITSHLTHSLTVLPAEMETDDAVQRLQANLAAATRAGKKNADGSGITIIEVKEDPELAGKRAEAAEREKLRADRKRQQLVDREQTRVGRRPQYRSAGGGLTVGGLEDDDGMLTTRARPRKRPRTNRRGEIYTDEEDEYDRRGHTREDEYDREDDFLVDDDEELEIAEDDEDEEPELEDEDMDAEGEIDDDVRPEKSSRKEAASPKRKSPEAGGAGSPPTRKKNRYRIESDEDEE